MPTLLAPAKINATLEVLGRRSDGYHTLRSVMLPLALYDRIELEASVQPGLRVEDPALERDNLVDRALAACGLAGRFAVTLHKAIPVGGGLGGGSSDAAAIVRAAMNGTLGAPNERDWLAVASTLGSDVPFFLCGTGALVEGVGERVTALGALPPWWCIVVRPHAAVATADAYRRLDLARASVPRESGPRGQSVSRKAVDALQRADFDAFCAALVNDFHDLIVAASSEVAQGATALRAAGAAHALLSGSGSCLFALARDEASARAIEARLDPAPVAASFVVPLHHDPAWR
ncbi:MAG: 4-(cytidine 5'-diphospho)-2-C-methyl-D-erythritol kinase [Candidatus Eremiobacteraeota bacterium]|nr:4-(cytidine 5'-diphospho)-2-C-methyl-D-erythritol kinase [Candidatus Eremiobacteraeota bacterium]MBC5802735.1 4-(cytidine 5'-diphospho)-2-C-methyl-D-erythritol kinase [Candidatus Eremiobacteraeota bacterium]MBC5821583.1 4-(cytidine 5'-diphospho)-2-C-methyl-D-erythritol kinase [Candidatus Eremiobacteraeota bacterium]